MKKIIFVAFTVLSYSVMANIEHDPANTKAPTTAELSKSRSCFQELNQLGCGHPKNDRDHFANCMIESFESLTPDCKTMMKRLYGKK